MTTRLTKFTAAATLALAVALTGCASTGNDLAGQVLDAVPDVSDTDTTLELAEIHPGDWDSYLVICPYETPESVNDRLGFTWNDTPDLTLKDSQQVLVLTSAGTVEETAILDRDRLDLCATSPWPLTDKTTPITLSNHDGAWTATDRTNP